MIFDIFNTDIYYINLKSQVERNNEFLSTMTNSGISVNRLHRVNGVPNRYKDSFDSHIKALKTGLAGEKPFIIIEDDMKVNRLPNPIDLRIVGGPIPSAVSLALSRYGVIDEYNYRGSFFTSYNYVRKAEILHSDMIRIFNMIVGNAVYYYDMEYVKSLIKELEFFYRSKIYISPITKSVFKCENTVGVQDPNSDGYYSYMPVDAIMAYMQPTTFFTALKIPAFYHPGDLEPITKFNLTEI